MWTGDISKCTGCSACASICAQNAITLVENEKGFKYPKVNTELCVNCGLCETVCCCERLSEQKEYEAFLVIHNDESVRSTSQSGGLFYGLAELVLARGGIVYGAAVCDDLVIRQIRVDNAASLHKFQGSKYVQSDIAETFVEISEDLKKGSTVIYSGTSCMIEGLNSFLTKLKVNTENLYTCDLMCYGVVSPKLYRENLKRVQEQNNKNIVSVNFRDKKFGWHSSIQTYSFEDSSKISENFWTQLMYTRVALRDCCYSCQYANVGRKPSDITMGDFWGIEKAFPDIHDDNKGFSLAVVHTKKGEELLNNANLKLRKAPKEHLLDENRNDNLQKSSKYDAFWKDYFSKGYKYCLRKYTIYGGVPFKVKRKLLKALNKW